MTPINPLQDPLPPPFTPSHTHWSFDLRCYFFCHTLPPPLPRNPPLAPPPLLYRGRARPHFDATPVLCGGGGVGGGTAAAAAGQLLVLDRNVWRTKPELMNYTAVLYGTVACPSLLQKYILKQQ